MVQNFSFRDIQVPSPGFGAMGISFGLGNNLTLEEAEPVLLKAIELGCTFWDTAVNRVQGIWQRKSIVTKIATRLYITLALTRSYLASSLENTMFATKFSVGFIKAFCMTQKQRNSDNLHKFSGI